MKKNITEEKRNEFIKNVNDILKQVVEKKTLDAWFFNWADNDPIEKKEAEHVVNKILPGKWRFVHLWGNFTDVGEGWFCNDDYEVYIKLASFSDEDDYDETINSFEVLTGEEVDYYYKGRKNIENKDE